MRDKETYTWNAVANYRTATVLCLQRLIHKNQRPKQRGRRQCRDAFHLLIAELLRLCLWLCLCLCLHIEW